MAADTPTLEAQSREAGGSRTARRLRAEGLVPGIVYGGGEDPVALSVTERDLRVANSAHSALIDLKLDGKAQPVLVREQQRHPVSGQIMHVDLIRVDLEQKVQAQVPVEVLGSENSPGIRFGGLLEQILREVTVECLPTEIPEKLEIDASTLEIGDSIHVSDLEAPEGTEIISDGDGQIASIAASRLAQQLEREDEEAETELAGEGEEEAEGGEEAADEEAASEDSGSDGDGE